jgi:hypothetical protein
MCAFFKLISTYKFNLTLDLPHMRVSNMVAIAAVAVRVNACEPERSVVLMSITSVTADQMFYSESNWT